MENARHFEQAHDLVPSLHSCLPTAGAMWGTYQPLLRADFTLFDEYRHGHAGTAPFSLPITAFWGRRDRRITSDMVHGWRRFTAAEFQCHCIEGNHLWPQDRDAKAAWLTEVVNGIGRLTEGVNGI